MRPLLLTRPLCRLLTLVPLLTGCLLSETPGLCRGDEKTHACRLAAVDPDAGSRSPTQEQNVTPEYQMPGEACGCDDECESADGRNGICVLGVCMTRALNACESGACPYADYCIDFQEIGPTCVPACRGRCEGFCNEAGYCVPGEENDCEASCSVFCG